MAKFNLTDESFNRSHDTVAGTPKQQTPVVYAVIAQEQGMMCGVADIVELLTDHCAGSVMLRGKSDGEAFQPHDVVLSLEGAFADLVTLETLYLGILSLSAATANMAALVEAAGSGIRIVDTSAPRFPPELIGPIANAAAIGGARGTSTQAGHDAVIERFGVGGDQICVGARSPVVFRLYDCVPPALPALYSEDLIECAAAYTAAASDISLRVRLDSPGRERDLCSEAVRRFGSGLEAVWLATPGDAVHQGGHDAPTRTLEMRILSQASERRAAQAALEKYGFGPGVTIETVFGVRDLLDSMGSRSTQIIAGGYFDAEKISAFRACQAPLDGIAADQWVEFAPFTSKIVRVFQEDQWVNRTVPGIEAGFEPERLPVIYQK